VEKALLARMKNQLDVRSDLPPRLLPFLAAMAKAETPDGKGTDWWISVGADVVSILANKRRERMAAASTSRVGRGGDEKRLSSALVECSTLILLRAPILAKDDTADVQRVFREVR